MSQNPKSRQTPRSSPRHPTNHTCDSNNHSDYTDKSGVTWRTYTCSVCGTSRGTEQR